MREEALEKIIERISFILNLDAQELGEETAFADLGLKSAHFSQITTYLEDVFDMEVPYMQFRRCVTIGDAADFIEELGEE